MPAHIHNKTVSDRWRNQDIPIQKQIYTISFHKFSCTKDNRGKTPTQAEKLHHRKIRKVIFQQTQKKIAAQTQFHL